MRNEPENEKLLMNANQHDESGTAQLERDGGTAFGQQRRTWKTEDIASKYAFIAAVLKAQRYRKLGKRERGVVRASWWRLRRPAART